ncbi:hypothetical protein JCM10908_002844 [Rhodotorula pacifica]|uniref:uncharacterized protein n=1 Tax=Rhodotorula pacifica TaxID=1495444 RepID=UPI00317E5A8A
MVRSFFLALTGLAALVSAADLQISTPPAIYQCQAAAFQYSCPNTPCTIIARPSGDATAIAHAFDDAKSATGSVSWQPVDQAEGTSVTLWITDKEGNTISSSALPVSAGSSDSCLKGGSGSATSASSAGSSSAASTGDDKGSSSATKTGASATASGSKPSSAESTSSNTDASAPSSSPSSSPDDSNAAMSAAKASVFAICLAAAAFFGVLA